MTTGTKEAPTELTNIEAELTKIKNSIGYLNTTLIRVIAASERLVPIEEQVTSIKEQELKAITSSLKNVTRLVNLLGTKLVEGINSLEATNTSSTKEMEDFIKASSNSNKLIEKLTFNLWKVKLTPFIYIKLMFAGVMLMLVMNFLFICYYCLYSK